jgi:hypothetical protein
MITQLETAFNITVDNDKAVSNPRVNLPTHHPHILLLSSKLANRQLTYNSYLSNTADLDVGRGPTRPAAL